MQSIRTAFNDLVQKIIEAKIKENYKNKEKKILTQNGAIKWKQILFLSIKWEKS